MDEEGWKKVTPYLAEHPINYTIVVGWSDRRSDRTYSASGSSELFSYTSTITVFNDPAS